jgi:hypothetical protein
LPVLLPIRSCCQYAGERCWSRSHSSVHSRFQAHLHPVDREYSDYGRSCQIRGADDWRIFFCREPHLA